MKVNINTKFWKKSNLFSKFLLLIGFFLVDLGIKINGFKESEVLEK